MPGAQPILGKTCAWCDMPAVTEIQVEDSKSRTMTNPQTGMRDSMMVRGAIVVPACDDHRDITEGQPPPQKLPRLSKAKDVEQTTIFDVPESGPRNAILGDAA